MNVAGVTAAPDILTVKVRPTVKTDWPYIIGSWAGSLKRDHSRSAKSLEQSIGERLIKLMARGATFLTACDPDNEGQILGWCCFEKPLIHYVFVKFYYRGQGIARQMLAELADCRLVYCTDWTDDATAVAKRHPFLRKAKP